ncbi:hypothetical protein F4777DRAFT_590960 [Nemania sp. FL0916]|nr:hypothetical protein F4777DRAFT_590960 [Nemania sp. FL0916]
MYNHNFSTPCYKAAETVPIAELYPDIANPDTKAVGGVVTITWPYNKVKGSFAFTLAEPDFRLRRNKGQVRVDFTGRAAKTAGDCGLGSNDEVLLSLAGAAWEAEAAADRRRSLPGADLGWRLVFSDKLILRIKRAETNAVDLVIVDQQPNEEETAPDPSSFETRAATKSPSPPAVLSPIRITSPVRTIPTKGLDDGEFASPAFVKRARMSYGSLFEGGFDIFEDDGGIIGKGRKRTRFGRDSSSWRYSYVSRSPTPEPATSSPKSAGAQTDSPIRAIHSPVRVEMADEGCQTTDLDQPFPQPTSSPLATQTDAMMPGDLIVNDASIDAPTEHAVGPRPQTLLLNSWPSESAVESIVQDASVPIHGEAIPADFGTPSFGSAQHLNTSEYSLPCNPWTVGVSQPAYESQQEISSPHSHEGEPFDSSGFGAVTSGIQLNPFHESDGLMQFAPGDISIQEPMDDSVAHAANPDSEVFNYPPLEPPEDIDHQQLRNEALTDYPMSYLEDRERAQPNETSNELGPQALAVGTVGSSGWSTINNFKAFSVTPQAHLDSNDGGSPERAVVIDESDSDSGSGLEPIAAEDAVNNGRAYALDKFEDAEAEDEVDAQYSDDDEPEYDESEIGGDYDTRNYEQPGDDEDDSHDEDLNTHPLDPEFDDGESWDEEEQEGSGEEDEEQEYELDEEGPKLEPQHAVRSIPTVIDLISSSEGESEDEGDEHNDTATEIQLSDAHMNPRIPLANQKILLEGNLQQVPWNEEASETHSQAPVSEADNSSEISTERREDMVSLGEEENEEEDEEEDEEEEEEDQVQLRIYDNDEGGEEGETEDENGFGHEVESKTVIREEIRIVEPLGAQADHHTESEILSKEAINLEGDPAFESAHDHKSFFPSQTKSSAELHESTDSETGQGIARESLATEPLSAADGLEILSRAVDRESNAHDYSAPADLVTGKVITQTVYKEQLLVEPPEDDSDEVHIAQQTIASEVEPDDVSLRNGGKNQLDQAISPKPVTEQWPFIDKYRSSEIAAPSSPPSTQSFQSHGAGDDANRHGEVTRAKVEVSTVQLPTPMNTQVTTDMNVVASFKSHITIEQQDPDGSEDLIVEEAAESSVWQDGNVDFGKDGAIEQRQISLIGSQPPSGELPVSSPAPSFQSQVDLVELLSPSSVGQIKDDARVSQSPSPEHDSNASNSDESFASHMETDEELQASILDNTQQEEHFGHGVEDYAKEPARKTPTPTTGPYTESESVGQRETLISPMREHTPSKQHIDEATPSSLHDEQLTEEAEPSSLHDYTPAKQLADDISAQIRRNFTTRDSPGEDSDASIRNDPSVYLARAANASKKEARKPSASSQLYGPRRKTLDARRSPTPETDDASIQFARASNASQSSKPEEDSYSMTAAKLQIARHLRDELPDCIPLQMLRQHLTKSLGVIAVAAMQPPDPQRAKGGPREYMMSFTITDSSIGPYDAVEALLYRPHKDTLPIVKYGDIVLLRNFTVVSLPEKGFGLRSNDQSSWAIFDYEDEPPQIRGPPVEYSQKWFGLLDAKARLRLERANKRIVGADKLN